MQNSEWGVKQMEETYLKERTKSFALNVIKLVESLPKGRTADVIGRQLLDAGTSVGANYRAACRARSPADFISKMGIVEEEADETIYWMELLVKARLLQENDISALLEEANQILAMTVSSIKTARRKPRR
jgi:four helix bundle protein